MSMRVPHIIGPYAVERELGRGNQGQVWLGKCRVTRRVVAIKVSHGKLQKSALERLRLEFELSRRVDSEGVVSALDLGQLEDGRSYVVSEYVEGPDLWQWRTTLGAVQSEHRRRRVLLRMRQVADILVEVHAAGVIHGDLKLSAVMVERQRPSLRLLDFGGARSVGAPATKRYFGTARYSSPEQLRRLPLTRASDMWSYAVMGVLLWAGQWPLQGKRVDVLARLQADPSLIRRTVERVDPGGLWGQFLRRCLSDDPQRRPCARQAVDVLDSLGARQEWSTPMTASALGRCRSVIGDMLPGALLAITGDCRRSLLALVKTLSADVGLVGLPTAFRDAKSLTPAQRRELLAKLERSHKETTAGLAVVYGSAADLAKHGFKSKRLVHVELPQAPSDKSYSPPSLTGLPSAVADAKRALESFCRQTASAEVSTARRALENQDVAAALSHARRAFAVWPGDSSVIGFLSELLMATQGFDELRHCLVMAAESHGADLEAIQYAWSRLESVRQQGPLVAE